MSRETLHAVTSLDALAITYAYRVAAFAVNTNVDSDNARQMTAAVRACVAADIGKGNADLLRKVNAAITDAADTRNPRSVIADDDADDLRHFVAYMTEHPDAPKQSVRYVRRVARYARTLIADDLLIDRNERRALNRRR